MFFFRSLFIFIPALLFVSVMHGQDCTSDGNVAIFSNYDGGYLVINVNQDIPDLRIGIASYEPTAVSFTGPFADNITEVVFAGYQPLTGTGNFHCDNDLAVSSVDAPSSAIVTILDYPPVTLISPDVPIFPGSTFMLPAGDNNGIIGCYSCVNDAYQGGANTSEQIIDFFLTQMGGELLFLKTQYACWCGTQNLDQPSSCCFELSQEANVAISADPSLTTCEGEEITLDAGPGYDSYSWSTGASTQTILVDTEGTYSVSVDSECGSATDEVEVTIVPTPELVAAEVQGAYDCTGGLISMVVVNHFESPGPYLFAFVDATGMQFPSVDNLATDLPPGMYTVFVESLSTGCTDEIQVVVPDAGPAFTTTISSEAPGCDPSLLGSITLEFTSFLLDSYTYTLLNSDGVVVSADDLNISVAITDLIADSYQLFIEGANSGCSFDTTILLVNEGPVLLNEEVTDLLCFTDSDGAIAVEIGGGTPPYDLSWIDLVGNPIGSSTMLNDLEGGTYFLLVEDALGCTSDFEFGVESPSMLEMESAITPLSCNVIDDGVIEVFGSGGLPPFEFSLDGLEYQAGGLFTGLEAGIYTPTIIDANGCMMEDGPVEMLHGEGIEVDIALTGSDLTTGDAFSLQAIVPPTQIDSVTYSWVPATGLSCSDCPNPEGVAIEDVTYELTVNDQDGCMAIATIVLEVTRILSIYVPNAFTPDNDGVNDYFTVYPGSSVSRIVSLKIFDRWGGLVYDQSRDPSGKGWDGTIGGVQAGAGVYTLLAEVEFITGDLEVISRSITLIR